MSPVARAARLRARLLLATGRRDDVIPLAQAQELRRAMVRRHPRARGRS